MKERIQKLLAGAGVASRRNVEEMVRQGRITVNGEIVTDLPILIDPQEDKVTADGEPVKLGGKQSHRRLYILLNKPKNVYSTNVAQGEQMRAIDLLPPNLPERVYPVGRLDAAATGLLLLTNDGELTNQLTHPRYGVPKTYRATVAGFVDDQTLAGLKKSGSLGEQGGKAEGAHDRQSLRVVHRSDASTVLEITIRESRDKQVRQLLADAGHKVRDLTRVRLGPLTLHGLGIGDSRPLTSREIAQLRRLGRSPDRPGGKNHHTKKLAGRP